MPAATRPRRSASRPLATPTQSGAPHQAAKARSKASTCGPFVNAPESISSPMSASTSDLSPAWARLRSRNGTLVIARRSDATGPTVSPGPWHFYGPKGGSIPSLDLLPLVGPRVAGGADRPRISVLVDHEPVVPGRRRDGVLRDGSRLQVEVGGRDAGADVREVRRLVA